jgi:hypothetical protein
MWLKITYRLIAFLAIIIGLNFLYAKFLLQSDLKKYSDLYPKVAALSDTIDVLYLGESSNITFSWSDTDKRAISDFVADYYPDLTVEDITQAGAHARIYYEILAAIADSVKINTVVVTMNYRSFSADWIYSELETALLKKTVLIRQTPALYNRFLLSFKGFGGYNEVERKEKILAERYKEFENNNLTYSCVKKWDEAIDSIGYKNSVGNIDWELTALAAANVKNFAFDLKDSNPRIQDFDKIVELAKKHKWNLVLSIMPENLENAEKLVGKELVELMVKNKNYLLNRYKNENVTVIDNLDAVAHGLYIDQDFPTEHYAEKGRKHVAQDISAAIKPTFSNSYVEQVGAKTGKRIYFFHDCERKEVWGQMQTLSTEKAYSGLKSSKFGKEQTFSLTLDYPFNYIPENAKSTIDIEFQLYLKNEPKDLQLVIEFSGDSIDFSWNAVPISQISDLKLGKWNLMNYTFSIPENVQQAQIIKIYLYNPTSKIAYLDDLKVQFK